MVETCAVMLVTITAIAWGRSGGPLCAAWVRDVVREMDPGRADADARAFTRLAERPAS